MTKSYSKKLLEEVPPDYYDRGIKENIWQRLWHTRKIQVLTKLLLGCSGKVLEVGCAGGMLTQKIKEALPHATVTGLDLYKQAIVYARKNHPNITFICADAQKLPFKKNTFDLVVAVETLEHLPNPAKALLEVRRVLKPGGQLIVGQDTDSFFFRIIWWLWTKRQGKVWHGVHVNCMKPGQLADLLSQSGFVIEKKVMSHLGLEVFFQTRKP